MEEGRFVDLLGEWQTSEELDFEFGCGDEVGRTGFLVGAFG